MTKRNRIASSRIANEPGRWLALLAVCCGALGAALSLPASGSAAVEAAPSLVDDDLAPRPEPVDDHSTSWCGNGCSTTEDQGIDCTDWTAGTGPNQECQAKAYCTGDECTVWGTIDAPPDVREILAIHTDFSAERYRNRDGSYGVVLTPIGE